MTKNPFFNALAASAYIIVLVTGIFNGAIFFGDEETIIIPIFMLSLFVFSAAMMAYLFLYQPLMYFFDGKKKEGVQLFLQTVGIFAGVTIALVLGFTAISIIV